MKKKERKNVTQFQWKILRIVLIAYLVFFLISGLIKNYVKEERDILTKIGYTEPISVSVEDAMKVNLYSLALYKDYLQNGKFEVAYQMLTQEYRDVFSYEDYLKSLEGIDFDTLVMEDIKIKTEGTYLMDVSYERNGESKITEYLIYVNEYNPEQMTISPNKFIYSYQDLVFEKDNIELTLKECYIYTDSVKMSIIVKNKAMFKTMEFINLGVGFGNTANRNDDIELVLEPGEEKLIEVEYDVNLYLPDNIKLKRVLNKNTLRTYTFYFEEGKKIKND